MLSASAAGEIVLAQGGNEAAHPAAKGAAPKEVLAPDQFFGKAQTGYDAAKQCPEVIAKLFCYCGCDMTDSHTSLLDCFTTDHGADCAICQDEAIMALDLKQQNKSMADIQKAIDKKFEKEYPYNAPTAILSQYRKTRLWQPIGGATPAPATKPTLKPGKQAGNCCGNGKAKGK
jgi:hypothetical protein